MRMENVKWTTSGKDIDRVARDTTTTITENTTYTLVRMLGHTRHSQELEQHGERDDIGVKMAAVEGGMDAQVVT
jgi:hypothetical protein